MDARRREWLGYALGLVGVVVFGATLPMTHIALASFDPAAVTIGRAFVAGLAAALLLARRRRFPRGRLAPLAVIAARITIGFPGFTALAMRTVPAAHGGVVLGILPLATALAAALVAHEVPSRRFWLWAGAGAAVVVALTLRHGGLGFEAADLYLLLACASAALGYALSGRLAREMPGWEVVSWVPVVSLPVTSIAIVPVLPTVRWDAREAHWLAFAYLGATSHFLGFFWNAGLALGGVARVGQVQLLQTFVTLALSALLLGETVDLVTILAATAIAPIVFLGRRAPVARREPAGPAGS